MDDLRDILCVGELTKRDFFAALAMQGYCASSPASPHATIASEAVAMAEALIAELSKKTT